jgi:hypothetical protein
VKPIMISLSAAKAAAAVAGGCKVCGARDHTAGFQGSVYLDCPNKPCYLCKLVRLRARAARGAARGCSGGAQRAPACRDANKSR